MLKEAHFGRLQEHQAPAFPSGAACSSPDTVNIVPWVIWRVELNDPIHRWYLENGQLTVNRLLETNISTYIKTSRGNICTYERAMFSITELEECIGPLLLLLLPV
jgi:hypothetical protein